MKKSHIAIAAIAVLVLTASMSRAESPPVAPATIPSPGEIVAAAPASDWTAIAASDLLVMDLAADAKGQNSQKGPRRVVIQLMPAPFSQGWVGNIRKLAAAKFWDGTSINRVQDNYVTQWGDATEKKALPDGLETMDEFYGSVFDALSGQIGIEAKAAYSDMFMSAFLATPGVKVEKADRNRNRQIDSTFSTVSLRDTHAPLAAILGGWQFGYYMDDDSNALWPVHCYGMVGVGRNYSPDTGSGAELYTVIGHAPRHLDRNIALVGRIIEGMEHMSSLPRGTGALGFYETPEERTGIVSVRMGSELAEPPAYEYLSTESESFAKYADARANRRDPFFIKPAGGADICNIPVPVRRKG